MTTTMSSFDTQAALGQYLLFPRAALLFPGTVKYVSSSFDIF